MSDGQAIADHSIVHAGPWPRSLRGQLALIPTVVLFIGLLATVGIVLAGARARITTEITSGIELGDELIATALRNVANDSSPADAFEHLAQWLPRVRHVQFRLIPSDGSLLRGTEPQMDEASQHRWQWLAQLLAPPSVERVFPVVVRGHTAGEVRLRSHSADEVQEIVSEVALFSGVLIGLCLLIVGAVLWTVQRSLKMVQLLADGFDRLEQGDYRPIAQIPLLELRRVGQQFNHLAQSLHRVTTDNHLLVDELICMQERERKELAAELHDEFGPALFGIRAEAACIIRAVPLDDASDREIRERARSIADLTDGIQKLNYRMLERLRPLVLEQMGLCQAVRQLVASWQARYPNMTWLLIIDRDFDEPDEATSLTLYRAAQECITNVIRHAEGSEITIGLRQAVGKQRDGSDAADADLRVLLSVHDNGKGLPKDLRYGFGLLGMAERVRRHGGILRVRNRHPSGAITEVVIPKHGQVPKVEQVHADPAD